LFLFHFQEVAVDASSVMDMVMDSVFVSLDLKIGEKFLPRLQEEPSFRLRCLFSFRITTLYDVCLSTVLVNGDKLTVKDYLELYLTAIELEKSAHVIYNRSAGCFYNKAQDIFRCWLHKLGQFPDASAYLLFSNIKNTYIKEYTRLVKNYNARFSRNGADVVYAKLCEFLGKAVVYGTRSRNKSNVPPAPAAATLVSPTHHTEPSKVATSTENDDALSSTLRTGTRSGQSTDFSSMLQTSKKQSAQLRRHVSQLQAEKQVTQRVLQDQTSKLNKVESLVGVRQRELLSQNDELQTLLDNAEVKLKTARKDARSRIDRPTHNKIVNALKDENTQWKGIAQNLAVQNESNAETLENLENEVEHLAREKGRLRVAGIRKQKKIEKLNVQLDSCVDKFRVDEEASSLYYNGIVDKLKEQVNSNERKEEEMTSEIEQLKRLETKQGGKYKSQIRLVYYDLLIKGVSANIIQGVITSVLENLTSLDMDNLDLPSRSTAQRLVTEAGELAKIRTAYELVKENGNIGHHSDGTTKSLIHWGSHILKLNIDGEVQSFTLSISPVPSGKASDTVAQLQEVFEDIRDLANMMDLDFTDGDLSVGRISARMSDRAPNEKCVSNLMEKEKETVLRQADPDTWSSMSEEERQLRTKIRRWTCASHKIDNMTNAMTDASVRHMQSHTDQRRMCGAKKLVYEANKLLCERTKKEYGKGLDFKMFAMDDGVYDNTTAAHFKPIVGNRYIIFLLNSIPTLLSRDIVLLYLNHLRDSKEKVGLNKLELSVQAGYLDEDTEVELIAFAILFFFVCQPLLRKAKGAPDALYMDWYYRTVIRKLAQYADNPAELLNGDAMLWVGAVSEDDVFFTPMKQVLEIASKHQEKLSALLQVMAEAGRNKLTQHASEHLDYEPTLADQQAASTLATATNDCVESCFGMLDREQRWAPSRNPVNTSALITAKKDKPVAYVRAQQPHIQELMVTTARKSAAQVRKKKGTKVDQQKAIWRHTAGDRATLIAKRKATRAKRQCAFDAVVTELKSGELLLDPDCVTQLKGTQLVRQIEMWNTLVSMGVIVQESAVLKGLSVQKVQAKKEGLEKVVQANRCFKISDVPQLNIVTENGDSGSAEENDNSSSDEEVDDMICHDSFKFRHTGGCVLVAFAGGSWYPGYVREITDRSTSGTALVDYFHPCSTKLPTPSGTLFRKPTKADLFDTDSASVFMWDISMDPISSSCRQYRLSVDIDAVNFEYSAFARLHNIPQ
jgi:hypothetical protein